MLSAVGYEKQAGRLEKVDCLLRSQAWAGMPAPGRPEQESHMYKQGTIDPVLKREMNKGLLCSVGLSRPERTVTQGHTIQLLYLEWTTSDKPTIRSSVHVRATG